MKAFHNENQNTKPAENTSLAHHDMSVTSSCVTIPQIELTFRKCLRSYDRVWRAAVLAY